MGARSGWLALFLMPIGPACYDREPGAGDDDDIGADGDADADGDGDADADGDADDLDCRETTSPWTIETPDPDAAGWAAIAVGPDGAPSLVYSGSDASTRFATKVGGQWRIDRIDVDSMGTSLEPPVFDATGAAHLSFREGSGDVVYATNARGAWIAETVGHVDAAGGLDFGGTSRVVIAPDGSPRVVFSDFAGLWLASYVDGAWSLDAIPGGDPTRIHAAISDPDGHLHVAFVTDAWEVRYGSDASGEWSFRTLDPDIGDAEFALMNMDVLPRLALDGGAVLVAYHAVGELRAVRIEPGGSDVHLPAVSTAALGEAHDEGADSLAFQLEPPGRWHVTYVGAGQDIHYASYCEGGWSDVLVLEDASFLAAPGFWAPLAVGSDGEPLAVYAATVDFEGYRGNQPTLLHP